MIFSCDLGGCELFNLGGFHTMLLVFFLIFNLICACLFADRNQKNLKTEYGNCCGSLGLLSFEDSPESFWCSASIIKRCSSLCIDYVRIPLHKAVWIRMLRLDRHTYMCWVKAVRPLPILH